MSSSPAIGVLPARLPYQPRAYDTTALLVRAVVSMGILDESSARVAATARQPLEVPLAPGRRDRAGHPDPIAASSRAC